MWNLISNAGDAALTLPLAALCAAWLACAQRRLAWRWLLALAVGMALVGATKILHAGCGTEVAPLGFRVISGHTTLATAVWPTLLGLFSYALARRPAPGAALGLAIGALIGVARVFDHSHSVSEVIAGWLLGCIVAAPSLRALARSGLRLPHARVAAFITVVILVAFYGHHAPFEVMINRYAAGLCARV